MRFGVVGGLLAALWFAPIVAEAAALEPAAQRQVTPSTRAPRAVGVNYYNGFLKTLRDPQDRSFKQGFALLKERRIPFVRFVLMGFFPSDMKVYLEDRAGFYSLLDEFIGEAQKNGIGLMPSLFFAYWQVPDLLHEPMQAWGDPNSKTSAFMRQFTKELLERYRGSPAIWGWEFSNEVAYYVDMDAKARPRLAPARGTPTERTERDDLRSQDMVTALAAFAALVRQIDPERLSSSGNAMPRADAHRTSHRTSERLDSRAEFAEILRRDNPLPLNMISVHVYPHTRYFRGEPGGHGTQSLLTIARGVARDRRQELFVGEFGVPTRRNVSEVEERRLFTEMLEGLLASGTPLSAIWDFDPDPGFDPEWNIFAPARRYQLDAVEAANERLRHER